MINDIIYNTNVEQNTAQMMKLELGKLCLARIKRTWMLILLYQIIDNDSLFFDSRDKFKRFQSTTIARHVRYISHVTISYISKQGSMTLTVRHQLHAVARS